MKKRDSDMCVFDNSHGNHDMIFSNNDRNEEGKFSTLFCANVRMSKDVDYEHYLPLQKHSTKITRGGQLSPCMKVPIKCDNCEQGSYDQQNISCGTQSKLNNDTELTEYFLDREANSFFAENEKNLGCYFPSIYASIGEKTNFVHSFTENTELNESFLEREAKFFFAKNEKNFGSSDIDNNVIRNINIVHSHCYYSKCNLLKTRKCSGQHDTGNNSRGVTNCQSNGYSVLTNDTAELECFLEGEINSFFSKNDNTFNCYVKTRKHRYSNRLLQKDKSLSFCHGYSHIDVELSSLMAEKRVNNDAQKANDVSNNKKSKSKHFHVGHDVHMSKARGNARQNVVALSGSTIASDNGTNVSNNKLVTRTEMHGQQNAYFPLEPPPINDNQDDLKLKAKDIISKFEGQKHNNQQQHDSIETKNDTGQLVKKPGEIISLFEKNARSPLQLLWSRQGITSKNHFVSGNGRNGRRGSKFEGRQHHDRQQRSGIVSKDETGDLILKPRDIISFFEKNAQSPLKLLWSRQGFTSKNHFASGKGSRG
mmetsp:Transcript_22564/g.27844  ORF Transcript_22564/g.27844 Transcript_22564/m.27844 type:complete len:536 (+) Transcript_22564:98-1705(+)